MLKPRHWFAAIEINATGAWFENTLIENSTTTGLRLYFVDSSTTFRNLKIVNSGDPGKVHTKRPSDKVYFVSNFDGLEITGFTPVLATSGGAMQGSNWFLHNNWKMVCISILLLIN